MSKFKAGDKCVPVSGSCYNYEQYQGDHIIVTALRESGLTWCYDIYRDDKKVGCCLGCFKDEDLKLMEKTMENLQIGDVLISRYDDEKEVLAVFDKVVIVDDGSDDADTITMRIDKLEDDGWTLKEDEPEVTELTLDEIASKFDLDPSKLRIKKEA